MKKVKLESKEEVYSKVFTLGLLVAGSAMLLSPELATAAGQTLGKLAENAQGSLGPIMKLVTGGAYVAGAAFGASSLMGLKQHAENPQQMPLKQPLTKMGVAAGLSYLGYFISAGGATMFGDANSTGGVNGFSSLN